MDFCCSDVFAQRVVHLPGSTENDDLFFSGMGELESRGGFFWEAVFPYVALHVVWEGAGMLETPAGRFTIHPHSIFTLWPGQRVKYWDDPKRPWKYVWFWVEGAKVQDVLKQCGLSPECPVRPAPSGFSAQVRGVVSRVDRAKSNPLYSSWLAWDCLRPLAESADPLSADPAAACKLLIDSSPEDIPSVDRLAEQLDLDRSTLFRHFREAYGLSPKQYIEQRRFRKACVLLKETALSVKEVASACGFVDPCYFSRAFRKRFDASPQNWRGGRGEFLTTNRTNRHE